MLKVDFAHRRRVALGFLNLPLLHDLLLIGLTSLS
jgi:hypothetical protein